MNVPVEEQIVGGRPIEEEIVDGRPIEERIVDKIGLNIYRYLINIRSIYIFA